MTSPPVQAGSGAARSATFIKTPIAVVVLAGVVLALGALAVGLVLEAQAARSDAGLDYVAVVAYASCAALTAALVLLGRALFSSPHARVQRLFRADSVLAIIAAAATIGNLLVMQIHDWTTTITCDGCDAITMTPTPNQIAASVALDLGAGAVAALLPMIAILVLRHRREAVANSA
ncbi:MAG: hypothetical protein JOZ75_06040 [Candidatus Dormibacteraeota bacterium]|nr:hypothetical protein [Candidatus Dormibacteraeota bacterium]